MAIFKDADHLYRVLDRLFERLADDPDISASMLAGNFVLRFRYTEPTAQVTIDLRQPPLSWQLGDSELEPDLEMIQSADVAHQFWLGRLNVPRAIATRQVVSRGPINKALKLLPAVKAAFPVYAEVLRELGYEELIPSEAEGESSWLTMASRAAERLREMLPVGRAAPVIDEDELNAHFIPLLDELVVEEPSLRDHGLPEEPNALRRAMLERMLLIRAFERRLSEAWAKGDVPTEAIHLSIGQEGTAVGVCFALRNEDAIATTHRGHGHMLAKGADLDGMMAEMLAKVNGLCGGKGGSMHVTDAAVGALGANGIVGASPLIAAGAAHAAKLRGSDKVAVAFMGDGATNQGMFHEALNFAAVFDLPAVFVVENNLYGEFTAVGRHMRCAKIADRAAAYGLHGETVDGNDPWATYEATQRAVERARAGEGGTLLECLTYRWHGHMEGEAVNYRSAEEQAAWKDKCPIKRLRAELIRDELLDDDEAARLEAEAEARVAEAYAAAVAADEPTPDALTTDVYAPEPRSLYQAPATPVASGGRELTYSQALFEALDEELSRDDRTYLLGEDVTTGGYFAVTVGLVDTHGPERIIDTPISEYAIVGSAVGAAMAGTRPIAEILFSDFLTTCMDPLVNQAAKLRYMSGGQYALPMVVRTPGGAGLGMAAQHSQSLEAWLTGIAGLIIMAPATPHDAKGMLKAAIRSNNPVLFFEDKLLYPVTGQVPVDDYLVPIGKADVKRSGRDATIVSVGAALGKALDAAEELAAEGTDVEIVDVRTLVPLDMATIVSSVVKTGRLITVEDAPRRHGFGSEIVARVVETANGALRRPPLRVGAIEVPIPYNSKLENLALPDAKRLADAVRSVMRSR